jgi:hypothetical protein
VKKKAGPVKKKAGPVKKKAGPPTGANDSEAHRRVWRQWVLELNIPYLLEQQMEEVHLLPGCAFRTQTHWEPHIPLVCWEHKFHVQPQPTSWRN